LGVVYARTRDWATVDYYAMLGVATDANDDEIARAFRGLAKQLHPDAGVPAEEAERFKEIAAADEVLSNRRTRRDYDAVRAALRSERIPGSASGTVGFRPRPGDPPPRFRAQTARPVGWTKTKAWAAFIGGMAVTVAGLLVGLFILGLQRHDANVRHGRVAVTATRVDSNGNDRIQFRTSRGQVVDTKEPNKVNPGIPGDTVRILYDPRHPTNVIADESYVARDITLWLVAAKLLVGGPVFAVLGRRALRRYRPAPAAAA
jgi:curved DNA-binding protein CbpA